MNACTRPTFCLLPLDMVRTDRDRSSSRRSASSVTCDQATPPRTSAKNRSRSAALLPAGKREFAGQVADLAVQRGLVPARVQTQHRGVATGGAQEVQQQPDRGGLPGAVRARGNPSPPRCGPRGRGPRCRDGCRRTWSGPRLRTAMSLVMLHSMLLHSTVRRFQVDARPSCGAARCRMSAMFASALVRRPVPAAGSPGTRRAAPARRRGSGAARGAAAPRPAAPSASSPPTALSRARAGGRAGGERRSPRHRRGC